MSSFPPAALLLVMLSAVVCVIVVDAPLIIVALSSPAALAVLTSAQGRRTFGTSSAHGRAADCRGDRSALVCAGNSS